MPQADVIVHMGYKLKYLQVKLCRKLKQLVKADEIAQSMIDAVKLADPLSAVNEVVEAKTWWKYALYASYIQAVMLADNFEFKIPRTMFEGFQT